MLKAMRDASPTRKTTGGFTLVEMLVVIVVIGVLAAIAVPIFLDQSDKANDAALKSDLANAARMLQVAEAGGVTLPSTIPAGQAYTFTAPEPDGTEYGTITPAAALTVSGSGTTLCVEGTSDSGNVYSADMDNGLRNYDCDGNANGITPLVLSYADTSFTSGSNNETLAATATGGDGSATTYSVSGSLPTGVTFDEATGTFTGPADSEWNFTVNQVSAGDNHTCAVLTNGTAKCWGSNGDGQLGDGSTTNSSTPVTVLAEGESAGGSALTGVTQISAGGPHTCVLVTNNTAKCWGKNTWGQLGDGTTTNSSTPVTVVAEGQSAGGSALTGVTQISAGGPHTCAVLTNETAKCWGLNADGRLGIGTNTVTNSTPVTVVAEGQSAGGSALTGVTQISAGGLHTCVLITNGTAKCMGENYGQLGDGTFDNSNTPVTVVAEGQSAGGSALTGVTQVEAGGLHTCVLMDNTTVKCFGNNGMGQLGDGTQNMSDTPVTVVAEGQSAGGSALTGVTQITSPSLHHTCALMNDNTVKCWGEFLPDDSFYLTPVTPQPALSNVTQISAGDQFNCALLNDGAVKCWGNGDDGQLGDGNTTDYSNTLVDVLFGAQFGAQPGFPATVDVTVTDDSGSVTESVTLTVG